MEEDRASSWIFSIELYIKVLKKGFLSNQVIMNKSLHIEQVFSRNHISSVSIAFRSCCDQKNTTICAVYWSQKSKFQNLGEFQTFCPVKFNICCGMFYILI